jgi:aspartyl protease family protein
MASWSDPDTRTLIMLGGSLLFLALLLPSLLASYRGQLRRGAAHVALWMAIFLGLIAGYAYRHDVASIATRISAELVPAGQAVPIPTAEGERAVRIRRSARGPFIARATVNGVELPMLVDTGASSVVLKSTDAERAGLDLSALAFTVAVDTANGSTFCAPVRLRQIAIGGITYTSVEALVAQPGNLKESLLGMSFLKRLRSYDFTGDFLTLRS